MNYAKKTNDHRVVTILIMPPSLATLEERLQARSTESLEVRAARIKQAERELSLKDKYQYNIVNEDLQIARNELRDILKKEIAKNA
jgi:guanylate kinase